MQIDQKLRLITPRETAKMLSVSERTLFSWSRKGILPCVRVGRIVRYDLQDVENCVKKNRR